MGGRRAGFLRASRSHHQGWMQGREARLGWREGAASKLLSPIKFGDHKNILKEKEAPGAASEHQPAHTPAWLPRKHTNCLTTPNPQCFNACPSPASPTRGLRAHHVRTRPLSSHSTQTSPRRHASTHLPRTGFVFSSPASVEPRLINHPSTPVRWGGCRKTQNHGTSPRSPGANGCEGLQKEGKSTQK